MRRFSLYIALAAVLMFAGSNAEYQGKNKFGVDVFTMDLDLAEEKRFEEVTAFYKDTVIQVLDQYMSLIPAPILILA